MLLDVAVSGPWQVEAVTVAEQEGTMPSQWLHKLDWQPTEGSPYLQVTAPEAVTFLATLPDILSAIKTGKDTVRIQLEVPKSEKHKLIPLYDAFEQVLEVTIRVGPGRTYGGTDTTQRTTRSPLDMVGG